MNTITFKNYKKKKGESSLLDDEVLNLCCPAAVCDFHILTIFHFMKQHYLKFPIHHECEATVPPPTFFYQHFFP